MTNLVQGKRLTGVLRERKMIDDASSMNSFLVRMGLIFGYGVSDFFRVAQV